MTPKDVLRIAYCVLRAGVRVSSSIPNTRYPIRVKPRNGFTLIEVIVASAILAIATGAVLRLSQLAIRGGDVALERTAAVHLVSEALEIVHQIRDTTVRDGLVNTWDSAFPSTGSPRIPRWNPVVTRWELVPSTGVGEAIVRDGVTYQRVIAFADPPAALPQLLERDGANRPITANHARQIRVDVRWRSGDQDSILTGQTLLTDWQGL